MTGVPPQAGSGHSPKGGAAKASPAEPSVPNAHDWAVAITLKRNDGTGDGALGHMIVQARTEADAIGAALSISAKSREGEHAVLWSAIPLPQQAAEQ